MPLKRCLFIAVVECAIKKKLKTLSIETFFAFPLFLKCKVYKEKAQNIEHRNHFATHSKVKIPHKEKAQNIEHRNLSAVKSYPLRLTA